MEDKAYKEMEVFEKKEIKKNFTTWVSLSLEKVEGFPLGTLRNLM